jgi:predicted transcriptional regulator YdeE
VLKINNVTKLLAPTKFFVRLRSQGKTLQAKHSLKNSQQSNGNILALYTDYEGDYMKPYSQVLGCEVSSLDKIPEGLVVKVIPEATYAFFTTQGEFPQGLISAWQAMEIRSSSVLYK